MGDISRWLNGITGGRRDETLCRRIAGRFGPSCLFCRLVGRLIRDDMHCVKELDGYPRQD